KAPPTAWPPTNIGAEGLSRSFGTTILPSPSTSNQKHSTNGSEAERSLPNGRRTNELSRLPSLLKRARLWATARILPPPDQRRSLVRKKLIWEIGKRRVGKEGRGRWERRGLIKE